MHVYFCRLRVRRKNVCMHDLPGLYHRLSAPRPYVCHQCKIVGFKAHLTSFWNAAQHIFSSVSNLQ